MCIKKCLILKWRITIYDTKNNNRVFLFNLYNNYDIIKYYDNVIVILCLIYKLNFGKRY